MAIKHLCSIAECCKPIQAKGWCNMHYMRWYKHGDTSVVKIEKGKNIIWLNDVALKFEGSECLPWPFDCNHKGYARLTLRGKHRNVSRFVCEARHGPAPSKDKWHAAHSCGNGHMGCVNPGHIRWRTPAQNMQEKNDHGTMARGASNGNSKINAALAAQVKTMLGSMTQQKIADTLGVNRSTVRDIKSGKVWAWV